MIQCKIPLRVSLFGGGTDYPEWSEQNIGSVISFAINKYIYLWSRPLPPFFKYNYLLRYYKREECEKIEDIEHPSIRNAALLAGLREPFELIYGADIPAMNGLGSSSAFTVGVLKIFGHYNAIVKSNYQIALDAIYCEQELNKEAVGSQDQMACAMGGFNRFDFNKKEVTYQPMPFSDVWAGIFKHTVVLVHTGTSRVAATVALGKKSAIKAKYIELTQISEICREAFTLFSKSEFGEPVLKQLGELLSEQWLIKRSLTPEISNSVIDEIYKEGMRHGALGGKLLGAGAGGFFAFLVPFYLQDEFISKFSNLVIQVEVDHRGAELKVG